MLAFFNKNFRRAWYKKSFLTQYLGGAGTEKLFLLKMIVGTFM